MTINDDTDHCQQAKAVSTSQGSLILSSRSRLCIVVSCSLRLPVAQISAESLIEVAKLSKEESFKRHLLRHTHNEKMVYHMLAVFGEGMSNNDQLFFLVFAVV